MLRRILSLMLALVLTAGMLPTAALATDETTPETVAETTEAIVETTEAAVETTEAEEETTESVEETAEAAAETTEAAVEATEAEETTASTEETTELTLEAQADAAMAAARAATAGSCGANMSWSITGEVLTISGTGDMKDYTESEYSPWRYADAGVNVTSIVVEEGVNTIGDEAFNGMFGITKVTLPASGLTSVGAYAFAGCTGLTEVVFSNGLLAVGDWAFADCDTLTVCLPASVTFVGEGAFSFCTGTVVVDYAGTLEQWLEVCTEELPANVKVNCSDETIDPSKQNPTGSCGENLTWTLDRETGVLTISGTGTMTDYNDSDNLSPWHNAGVTVTGLVVEDGVASIGDYAFVGISGLKEVTLPGSVESIGDYAFASCTSLSKVTLSEGTKTIGENAFADCEVLAKVVVPESMESIAASAFTDCPSYLTVDYAGTEEQWKTVYTGEDVKVNYPEGDPVTSGTCGDDLSWSVSEDGVLTISGTGDMADFGENAPWSNPGVEITGLVIEDGVTGIADNAFAGLTQLKEITIPASVESIGSNAFASCEGLTTITFEGDAPAIAEDAFNGVTAEVNYPQTNKTYDSIALSQEGFGGDLTWNTPEVVDQGTTSNGMNWTLDETGALVIDGSGANAIPEDAFAGRTDITTVVLPDSVTEIGDGAFSGCTNLEDINLDNVTKLGEGCFEGCDALVIIDLTVNPTLIETQKTELTYNKEILPKAFDPSNFRWEVISTTAESHTDLDAVTGELHITHKADVIIRCKDMHTGAQSRWNMHSEYVPVIVIPQLEEGSPATAKMLTENAEPAANEKQLSKYAVYLDKEDVASGAYKFNVAVSCADSELDLSSLKWSSTNAKIATIKGNTVTVKKKADGAAVIMVAVKDGKKTVAEGMLSIYVREYKPRLDATSFTLNTKLENAAITTGLVESYGNKIKADTVKLYEYSKADKGYTVESTRLIPSWENGVLTIKAVGELPKGAIKARLSMECYNEELDKTQTYTFDLKITVKNSVPAITAKQTGKFNLFYKDSTAQLKVTAKKADVLAAELVDCDFVLTYNEEAKNYTVSYAPTYDGSAKADAKGTLKVTVDGYAEPVTKAITITTVTTAPKLVMTPASSTIHTALGQSGTAFNVTLDGEVLPLTAENTTVTADFATAAVNGGVTLADVTASGTASVSVKLPEWTQAVTLNHKVTLNTKLPTAKLSSTTLNLNSLFTQQTAEAKLTLSHANVGIKDVTITAADKKANVLAEGEKIAVVYANGTVTASIKDLNNVPANGTYSYNVVVTAADENATQLKAVTLKVKVAATAPTVKLATTSLKLNKQLKTEVGTVSFKITKGAGYTLNGFAVEEGVSGLVFGFDTEAQQLQVSLASDAAVGKQTVYLHPVFSDGTQEKVLDTALKLTVQVYDSGKLTVSVTSKGKINTIVPDSAITYTVKKISNALGKIEDVKLYGQDADKFNVVLGEENGKQTFKVTMKDGVQYNTKTTYKVGFKLIICGYEFDGPVKSFKVTQSKLKFSIVPKTARFYQSQSGDLKTTITLTAPEGTTLESIKVNTKKTVANFIRSLGNGNILVNPGEFTVGEAYRNEKGQLCVDLSFDIRNTGYLTPGKSFAVYLDITPNGNASNVAATQLKLTVKAYK